MECRGSAEQGDLSGIYTRALSLVAGPTCDSGTPFKPILGEG